MADNSLVTKAHLRQTAENTVEKLNEVSSGIRQEIEDSAYIHPGYTARSSGLYKIAVDNEGHVSSATAVTASDVTGLGILSEDDVYQAIEDAMYIHPGYTARASGLYKIAVDNEGHVSSVTAVTKADITALGIPGQDTDTVYTHPEHTAYASGLYKITVDDEGHVTAATAATKADITALGLVDTASVSSTVSTHNSSGTAHSDIRELITGLTTRLNTLADSDDTTLDQMSEIVAYIKSNKTLIEEVTTNKVNVSDIINNLTTNASNKPLSAAQGVALKALIDGLEKADIGLGNVDNTSDANKPVSTAQATAIADAKKAGTDAQTQLTAHNTATDAHEDIRQAIEDAMYTHPGYTARSSGLYKITVDATGHVSAVTAVTKADITALGIPAEDTNTVYTHPSYTAKSSGLYKITVDATGHVSAVTAVTKDDITALGIPAQDTDTVYTHPTTSGNKHIPSGGSSGQILRWSADGTAAWGADNDTVYTHPSYTARTGVPTANATPGFGGTFSVTQPVSDATGHITAMNSRTITIPSTAASSSATGLMSASDYSKLANIESYANHNAPIVAASSTNGTAYTGTANGITALTAGLLIVFVPNYTSASTAPTFNLNSLGAKTIKRRLSGLSSTLTAGNTSNWLYSGKPQLLMYDGTYWIVVNQDKPQVADLYGSSALVQYANSALSTLGGTSIDLGGAKIQTGSYTGTGTYGSSNPCSLTFDFVPKLFFVFDGHHIGVFSLAKPLTGTTYAAISGGWYMGFWHEAIGFVTSTDYTCSWYVSTGTIQASYGGSANRTTVSDATALAFLQFNAANSTYPYCAFG